MRFFLFVLALAAGGLAHAATLYQWKDDAGVTHFTDNPANVPPQYREKGEREVKGVESSTSMPGVGEKLWREKCAACHHLGEGALRSGNDTRYGLRSVLFSSYTDVPFPVDTVREKMMPALNGKGASMPAIQLSDEELGSLIKYMQRAGASVQ